jgi:hypothetical protein
MCPVRIAPALRVEDAFRAVSLCDSPRAKDAQGYILKPLRGKSDMEPAASCSALEITQRPAHRTFTRRHADTPKRRYAFFAIAACAAARRATGNRNGLQLT